MLQVGIVGAGIAGLSAAIALSRAGHHVEIVEKSRFTYETGAAITVGPNGTRILSCWGFGFDQAGAVDCTRMTRIRADTLELDSEDSFKHIQPTYEIAKDLIIVADGAHSNFITKFIGRPYPVHKSPLALYRFLLPYEQVVGHPEIGKFFDNRGHGITTFYKTEIGRPGLLLSTYSCRSGNIVYCGVLHPSKPKEKDLEGWTSPASVEDVMSVVEGFHTAVQAVCRDAKDVKMYTYMWREPIETFTKGKAILIGDACHLMLSTHGQGACMALEDAMALEVLFANVREPNKVLRAAQTYDKLRRPRVSAIQTMSNKMKPGMAKSMLEEVKSYFDGPVPAPEAKTFSKEYNDFFFAYDVAEEAKKLQVWR